MRPSNLLDRGLCNIHLQPRVKTTLLQRPDISTACPTGHNRQLQHASNMHLQSNASSDDNALKLSRLRDAPAVRKGSAGNMASIAAGLVPAITQYTGEAMLQLQLGMLHRNPFTEVVWQRGPRRWKGLRKGHPIRVERPAPWLLEVRHHLEDLQHHFFSLRQHFTAPNVLMAAVFVAGLLLAALLVRRALQRQGRQQAQPLDDPEVLARKAASLDQQRSRFRRALGAQEDVPEVEPAFAADITSASTLAEPQLPADVAISERGLDDFDAWDEDTQKQWKRFMKGSRSQEIDEEQWWDIDRDELPADRPVYQDFN